MLVRTVAVACSMIGMAQSEGPGAAEPQGWQGCCCGCGVGQLRVDGHLWGHEVGCGAAAGQVAEIPGSLPGPDVLGAMA